MQRFWKFPVTGIARLYKRWLYDRVFQFFEAGAKSYILLLYFLELLQDKGVYFWPLGEPAQH